MRLFSRVLGRKIPQYDMESVPAQLRILRTHMAAQASELSTMRQALADVAPAIEALRSTTRLVLHHVTRKTEASDEA